MSIHKLTAGSGYDYLTRQVAALDATDKGHQGLASYYTEKGETPGLWVGSGLHGIDGLDVGDVVTADHMQNLFGAGHHPLATDRVGALDRRIGRPDQPSPTAEEYRGAARLGRPYKVYENDVSAFRVEVARRLEAINQSDGLPADWPVPADRRAEVRTEVARDFFRAEHGRDAVDAREIAATIAKHSRPRTNAVAGYDLTFSPVKSVSTLWALADPTTAATIERAHRAAVGDALRFIETTALFTRKGTNGVRQVDVQGLVAAAFTHRDSRAGDPDLHTHVAVANKVQTLDGEWLAIDGRVLFKATVAASETYNTALEQHLGETLGLRFAERLGDDARKRPIREVVGIDPALNRRFSKRRLSVEERRDQLAVAFQHRHGRPPTPVETLHLAQQATLETREAKHEPRSLAEQRDAWHREALEVVGSDARLQQTLDGALQLGRTSPLERPDEWVATTAAQVVATMESGRATWQYWHVYAEAQRQARAADVDRHTADQLVSRLVEAVLDQHSISLARPSDGVSEPAELRRRDGHSVYSVARSNLFTSNRVLDAEHRLVAAAGRLDGRRADASNVDLALLESVANGVTLNPGQATLVREMATSGARLQLAIAPAGSGKTTAMRALAAAWTDGGGSIVGLAPSAAAADALRTQIDTRTDTLAKLTHSLAVGEPPDWVDAIGPDTLIVIDEAGMADTLALDAAVAFALERGASVRLVGDDQQLSAIGAGGVLRDIRATHGCLQLSELVRFRDPAEAAASLALRSGRPEALGFYLDRDRVHVGDQTTMAEEVFEAWRADRARGVDALMLAPTRDLVADLNRQARAHRLDGAATDTATAVLADGNTASAGDLLITRENSRRLRTSATDWVKNGDRWTVLTVHDDGSLSVQHSQHHRTVRLPADYVRAATELGYACTVHAAQGVSVDTMHGLLTGSETRQQLYTMLSRGGRANHLYLEVVGDGDPHSVIQPDLVHPRTPTDVLESVLARDGAPRSASGLARDQADPTVRLGEATQRYLDGLVFAAEQVVGSVAVQALEASADNVIAGLSDDPAWPALRAHLLLAAAAGDDPGQLLRAAAESRELASASDRAAVLDWRLDPSGLRSAGSGPLPWTPAAPPRLATDPRWGPYLAKRAHLVKDLARQVREKAENAAARPDWANTAGRLDQATIGDVEVWRAAMQVGNDDRRPTGAPQLAKAAATWQRRLNRKVAGDDAPAQQEWRHVLETVAPQVHGDDFTVTLAERLAAVARAGVEAHKLLRTVAADGPLPDDHPAAALWWRMVPHLAPSVDAEAIATAAAVPIAPDWADTMEQLVGGTRAERIRASSWWPALASNIEHGLQRGWTLPDLLAGDASDDVDECQTLVWRTSIVLHPIPEPDHHGYDYDEAPADLYDGVEPPSWADENVPVDVLEVDDDRSVTRDLILAATRRDLPVRLEPEESDLRHAYAREQAWRDSPVGPDRLLQTNELTQAFFEANFPTSWGREYLADRLGTDLTDGALIRPGHAPAGWTHLVQHLRHRGVTDDEMIAAGVATTTRDGRTIDRFRDRLMFPITDDGQILGFIGRRHPELSDEDRSGPKYLNTPETPLFHKGDQLFIIGSRAAGQTVSPVLVEGPVDALAAAIASSGQLVGAATLGTALTTQQATQLANFGQDPIVATDPDEAGRAAAERAFWMLTPHGLDPRIAELPTGLDPAALLQHSGRADLAIALACTDRLAHHLITQAHDTLPPTEARQETIRILAAGPYRYWPSGLEERPSATRDDDRANRRELRDAIKTWDDDPRRTARSQIAAATMRQCDLDPQSEAPACRWADLAREVDPRLLDQNDWPATANMIQEAHDRDLNVADIVRGTVRERALGAQPAQELRYRLITAIEPTSDDAAPETRTAGDPHRPIAGSRTREEARSSSPHEPAPRR